ncbi:MAG: hypothetical protein M1840_004937 [Geoglossum simile]|nr:MAG: hypothetical protein M1840_004937 [Geoglossum simile]
MSEYWKSTPKYWCKHCKTYVRDTKLEKQNHEATPKHQGNLKRFLRDLHRGHERDEREKQRAKDEVERLNNVVSGAIGGSTNPATPPWKRRPAIQPAQRQITPAERKQQMAQLAELGVAIPDEFRGEMAMAGEWQTVSERVIRQEESEDVKPDAHSTGVRKRKPPGEESDEENADAATKRSWGSSIKTYPTAEGDTRDLDALLRNQATPKGKGKAEQTTGDGILGDGPETDCSTNEPPIKREDLGKDANISRTPPEGLQGGIAVKAEEPLSGEVVFKKRKVKNVRQK